MKALGAGKFRMTALSGKKWGNSPLATGMSLISQMAFCLLSFDRTGFLSRQKEKGDQVRLRYRGSAGYGIDPRGTIIDCVTEENMFGEMEDFYIIEMDRYDYDYHEAKGDEVKWYDWFEGDKLPNDHRRVIKRERHNKWNIEYHFKKKLWGR